MHYLHNNNQLLSRIAGIPKKKFLSYKNIFVQHVVDVDYSSTTRIVVGFRHSRTMLGRRSSSPLVLISSKTKRTGESACR
ncbi:unnamed protein product [Amoebophrya sp. A25]|nr:unnamed protein product [Amoebophrya sp. A25]|eukprot:GSA25T00014513001.1